MLMKGMRNLQKGKLAKLENCKKRNWRLVGRVTHRMCVARGEIRDRQRLVLRGLHGVVDANVDTLVGRVHLTEPVQHVADEGADAHEDAAVRMPADDVCIGWIERFLLYEPSTAFESASHPAAGGGASPLCHLYLFLTLSPSPLYPISPSPPLFFRVCTNVCASIAGQGQQVCPACTLRSAPRLLLVGCSHLIWQKYLENSLKQPPPHLHLKKCLE